MQKNISNRGVNKTRIKKTSINKAQISNLLNYSFGIIGILVGIIASYLSYLYYIKSSVETEVMYKNQKKLIQTLHETQISYHNLRYNEMKMFYINRIDSLTTIINPINKEIHSAYLFLSYDSINSKYGFIDIKQRIRIPYVFDYADNFEDNLARVKVNNKWGFINIDGEFVILPKFEETSSIHLGHFIADGLLYTSEGVSICSIEESLNYSSFEKNFEKTNIIDKELILRVLSMYSDPLIRNKELLNVSKSYMGLSKVIIETLLTQIELKGSPY